MGTEDRDMVGHRGIKVGLWRCPSHVFGPFAAPSLAAGKQMRLCRADSHMNILNMLFLLQIMFSIFFHKEWDENGGENALKVVLRPLWTCPSHIIIVTFWYKERMKGWAEEKPYRRLCACIEPVVLKSSWTWSQHHLNYPLTQKNGIQKEMKNKE